MNQFDVSILKSSLKRSRAANLKRGRGLSFLQYCNQPTDEDDCWSLIHQIQNIPSSTALLIIKGWPSHVVGGKPNLLFMVITQISVTIECSK